MSGDLHLSRQVEAMAGYGIPAQDIATALGIDLGLLVQDYRTELAAAAIKANARVAESLFRKATGEGREAVVAAIFWLKTRAGWRETSRHEVAVEPVEVIETDNRRLAMAVLRIIARASAETDTAEGVLALQP